MEVEENRKGLERRDDLEAVALSWEAAGKPEDGLPGVGQVAYYKGAEAPSGRAMGFLAAAEEKERRRVRRVRGIIVGLGVGVVTMAGLGAVALYQRGVAQKRLTQAVEVADQVNFTINRDLEENPGNG